MYPKELSWSPLRNFVFINLHCICCKLQPPIDTTAFSCFFWISWFFFWNYLTRGKPRTTVFLSPNTLKAKFSLITTLGNSPDNPWLLWVFTHELKLSWKRVSRVKTLCLCMSTLLVIVHIRPAPAYHLCNIIFMTTMPCQPLSHMSHISPPITTTVLYVLLNI